MILGLTYTNVVVLKAPAEFMTTHKYSSPSSTVMLTRVKVVSFCPSSSVSFLYHLNMLRGPPMAEQVRSTSSPILKDPLAGLMTTVPRLETVHDGRI